MNPLDAITQRRRRADQRAADAKFVREAFGLLAREAEDTGRSDAAGCLLEVQRLPVDMLAKLRRLLK